MKNNNHVRISMSKNVTQPECGAKKIAIATRNGSALVNFIGWELPCTSAKYNPYLSFFDSSSNHGCRKFIYQTQQQFTLVMATPVFSVQKKMWLKIADGNWLFTIMHPNRFVSLSTHFLPHELHKRKRKRKHFFVVVRIITT